MGTWDLGHWIIAAFFFFIVAGAIKRLGGAGGVVDPTGNMICPACGSRGEPAMRIRGSLGIEIVLWLCLLVPGLIYSLWRLTTRHPVCPACAQPGMIPIDTPVGRKLLETKPPQ